MIRGSRAFVVVLAVMVAATAGAATFTVVSNADSGAGTLREAMVAAEANAEADTITFSADMTIVLASPLPSVTTDITVQGRGWERTIIDGGNPPDGDSGVQLFVVTGAGDLVLDGVMLRNAYGSTGGAVHNDGHFVFRNSYASANVAEYGGFLFTVGISEVETAWVVGNHASYWGGGIAAEFPHVRTTLTHTSLLENTAANSMYDGSAVFINTGVLLAQGCFVAGDSSSTARTITVTMYSTLVAANCTFAENYGTAVYCAGEALLTHCTIAGNRATPLTADYGGHLYLENSVLADNGGSNCVSRASSAGVTSIGGNIEDADTCEGSTLLGDLLYTDPLLGPLTVLDRGGLDVTYYYPLAADSPAVDSALGCSWDDDADATTPEVALDGDQRRFARPFDGDSDGSAVCDRGAVEYHGLILWDGFESGNTDAWSTTTP